MSSNLSSIITFIILINSGYSSALELAQANLKLNCSVLSKFFKTCILVPEEYNYIENDLVNVDFHKVFFY